MKVFFDHNISPALARAVRELFRDQHAVTFLSEKFKRTTADVEWISALSEEGRWVIISGDRRITKNKAEYNTFRSSKLIGFFLSPGLNKAPVIKQLERILAQWENIEKIAGTVQGGAMFELQMKSTRIQQLK
ncbi:PIN-like domain-containing protein [Rhodoblastus sp.]|uniref:PIN-like domain-containing protein n=1 Tax=Rhodoblastus sp. TaxID=1962975 RepID=UPI003F981398